MQCRGFLSERGDIVMTTAIVLAGGSGSRMNSDKAKQYIEVGGVPLIVYSLRTFQESPVDSIVLVVREGDHEYVQREIVERFGISKVKDIVPGGKERFDSVWAGIQAAVGNDIILSETNDPAPSEDKIMIHDGARPFVSLEMIIGSIEAAGKYGACTVAVPVKDTIKVVDKDGFGVDTPDRTTLYQVQTPQTFRASVIIEAHKRFREDPHSGITDDTMLVEEYLKQRVYMVPGDYRNLKVTTPEDIVLTEALVGKDINSAPLWMRSIRRGAE